jgi:hypothetical protein
MRYGKMINGRAFVYWKFNPGFIMVSIDEESGRIFTYKNIVKGSFR